MRAAAPGGGAPTAREEARLRREEARLRRAGARLTIVRHFRLLFQLGPAAAIHPAATLGSIADAARSAAGKSGKGGKYRISKKRAQPYDRTTASSSDGVNSA